MGLLTDPSAGQGKVTKALIKYHSKLCVLLYIAGIIWFCVLAYSPMNQATYFSENALLAGLVRSEFREENAARIYYDELLEEMKSYDNSVPYSWLVRKFRQIGLDTYTHNFSLNYPLGNPQRFTGKNVYGIMRAARAASTESLVFSVPYRPPKSIHASTAASVAIMLAFAKFSNREKYWAKDIIFLITEHEQLGAQAWLEAYHGVQCGQEGTLNHGDLKGRAGAIQAAINLELHDINVAQIDIKIEGLNGQLPNLDLFNLAAKMCMKEGVSHTFKNRVSRSLRDPKKDWMYSFKTLMAMVFTQATGVPNGNHGLFHRFGIEALTLEGFSTSNTRGATKASLLTVGRILEGIFRSLNNLLERFHQSYFFYLLPSSERFISIGLYMPAICLMAGALFIRGCAKWCKLQEPTDKKEEAKEETNTEPVQDFGVFSIQPKDRDQAEKFDELKRYLFETEIQRRKKMQKDSAPNMIGIVSMFIFVHFLGILLLNCPQLMTQLGTSLGYKSDASLYYGLMVISAVLLFTPVLVRFKQCSRSITILNVFACLELGTALICISMNNFSLALFCAVIYVPFSMFITDTKCRIHAFLQKAFWLLLHPLVVLTAVVAVYTFLSFPSEKTGENISRIVAASQQAIVFAIVDSMIYGNWLYSVICSVLIPNWLCFWLISFNKIPATEQTTEVTSQEKKAN